jgi:hypothetical protein
MSNLGDLVNLMIATYKSLQTGPKIVERTSVVHTTGIDIKVSTVLTSDTGYETALIIKGKVYPVECYPNVQEAEAGHQKWVNQSAYVTQFVVLGYGSSIDPETIALSDLWT